MFEGKNWRISSSGFLFVDIFGVLIADLGEKYEVH